MSRYSLIVLALFIFTVSTTAWGWCPEDPNDRGLCDTMYMEAWPEDEILQGSAPYLVRVPIYVTSDVADSWDSIVAFVIPLCFTSTNPAANVLIDPYYNKCGSQDLYPASDLDRSIFRHLPSMEYPQVRNWMMDLSEQGMASEWDTRILDLITENNFRLALAGTGASDHRFEGGSRVLLVTMTLTLQDSTTIVLDTCFWPPTNRLTWVIHPEGGGPAIKKIPRPGTEETEGFRTNLVFGLPDILNCDRSYSDPCLVACPLGDIPFRVYLRDNNGSPVAYYSNVWLDFSACSGIIPCATETSWPIVHPDGPSDNNGVMTFHVNAGGCDEVHQVEVRASCGLIGNMLRPVKSVDPDGDLVVRVNDWHGIDEDPCNDYNCNGEINYWDADFLREHIAHSCVIDSCLLLSQDLTVTPDTLLPVDSTHRVQLFIKNNNSQPCSVTYVSFHRAGFGQGTALIQFALRYLNRNLMPGDTVTAEADFVVPGPGSGYILTRLSTECCDHPLDAIFNFTERLCPPDSMVYVFPLFLSSPPASIDTFEYLPDTPGWYWILYQTGNMPDSVAIVTPDTSILGVTGGVTLYFYDGGGSCLGNRVCDVRITLNSGDVNSDCVVNVGDIVYLVNYLYRSSVPPNPLRAGDVNCDCVVNVGDVVYLVNYLYRSGVPPVASETCECGYKEWFPR